MRKQLLACAVLAVTMVPSLAGAALISIAVNEGAVPPVRRPGVLLGTNALPNNYDHHQLHEQRHRDITAGRQYIFTAVSQ